MSEFLEYMSAGRWGLTWLAGLAIAYVVGNVIEIKRHGGNMEGIMYPILYVLMSVVFAAIAGAIYLFLVAWTAAA